MTPPKRKVDSLSATESSGESPHKRTRSESIADAPELQDGTSLSSNEHVDDSIKHRPDASSGSPAAYGEENETVTSTDLPQTWDQASAADKMLVSMRRNKKISWSRIERCWERSTGENATKGMLQDRYKQLQEIIAETKKAVGGKPKAVSVEEPFPTTDGISALSTTELRLSSSAIRGPSDESLHPNIEDSEAAVKPTDDSKAVPASEVVLEQNLPQSWEQASAGDQLIVRMKTRRRGWTEIEEAWQVLTGEQPEKGALRDRYTRIKDNVICPKPNGASTHKYQMKVSASDGASDQSVSRAKPVQRALRKRKSEAEPLETALDEPSDASSPELSLESPKDSIDRASRKPRKADKEQARTSTLDAPSELPTAKRTKFTSSEPNDGKAAARSSESGARETEETADEMLVKMKESGSDWTEIRQAWTERTGLTRASETLRKRYAAIKKGSASKLLSITPASSKGKVQAASPDEGSYDSSMKRNKTVAKTPPVVVTPVKRNMDRGKRKSSVKYAESTTDEDELYTAPVEPATAAATNGRRGAGRSAKVDRSDPEWLVTNEKSPLAHEDLHAEFSNPKTYENFTKSDWEDLRETLPPNVPFNPDGYSIPMNFFKYDPDFRRGIREFQEDLGSGHLDPKWQDDAAQAMEARARGEFDAYKENQYEEFWGQKQRLSHDALAGESTKIKLELLIQNHLFKTGDYFSYSRVFGRGKNGVLIEKDCKIVKLDDNALTFAIPPGQRKYSRHFFEPKRSEDVKSEPKAAMAGDGEEPLMSMNGKPATVQHTAESETKGAGDSTASKNRDGASTVEDIPEDCNLPGSTTAQDNESIPNNSVSEFNSAEARSGKRIKVEANTEPPEHETHESMASGEERPNGVSAHTNGTHNSTPALQEEEDILHSISNLTQLEHRIVDIDGRFNSKEISIQNTWKNFRGLRSHQDLGTLFEMREDFYVYKHPQIVKEAKRKR